MEAEKEISSDSELDLSPFFCNRQLSDQDIEKSPALRGIQSLLYDRPALELQATYRTEGNNYMREASRAQITDEERRSALDNAFECYSQAIDVKIEPGTNGAASALSLIYSNRSEALRLLNALPAAFYDADEAEKLDPKNYKAFVRKAKVCEDLEDFARAVVYWKECWEATFKPDVGNALATARRKLDAAESNLHEAYSAATLAFKSAGLPETFNFGPPLQFLLLSQEEIIQSYEEGVTVYLINQKQRTVDILEKCDLRAPLKPACKATGVARLTYIQSWADLFVEGEIKLVSTRDEHEEVEVPLEKPLWEIVSCKQYTVPTVIAFFAYWSE